MCGKLLMGALVGDSTDYQLYYGIKQPVMVALCLYSISFVSS